jgi:outer membrane biosynthesis protein TonB
MSRLIAAIVSLLVGIAVAVGLAACGSGSDAKLLAGNTAQEITENLDAVKQLAAEHECVSAEDAAQQVATQVDGLEGIDPKLKETLEKGAVRLNEVVDRCEEEEEPEETTELEEEEPETSESEEEEPKKKQKPEKQATPPAKESKPEKETGPPAEPPEPPGHGGEAPPGHEEGGGTPSGGIGPGSEAGPQGGEGGG